MKALSFVKTSISQSSQRPVAIILDFDGVIVDSEAAHLEAWDLAVRQIFARPLDEPGSLSAHASRTIGAILAARYGDPSQASSLVAAKERALTDTHIPPLFDGVRNFLAAAQQRDIPLGVASNSRRAYVHAILQHHGLHIRSVVCGDEVSRPKPHPDILWACSNALGVHPQQRSRVLAFDDAPHGLAAAQAAGMQAIGVTSACDAQTLRRNAAVRHVVSGLGDALELLDDRNLATLAITP